MLNCMQMRHSHPSTTMIQFQSLLVHWKCYRFKWAKREILAEIMKICMIILIYEWSSLTPSSFIVQHNKCLRAFILIRGLPYFATGLVCLYAAENHSRKLAHKKADMFQFVQELNIHRIHDIIGVRGGGGGGLGAAAPRIFQIAIFGQKMHLTFGQNHLIFGQAMEKILGQLTSAPLNETGLIRLCMVFC